MADTQRSPFKFLDAFDKDDKDLFFGREDEVDQLYDMTFDTRLIVFFGASGTGKTSLVQCGLANKFPETRWQELYIRRKKNINESILEELNTTIQFYDEEEKPVTNPIDGLNVLHELSFKPTYITFDQFEELFILEPDKKEQESFFQFLQNLLNTSIACKVILVMREEFIAHLWDYEHLVPSLFDNRFRITQFNKDKMKAITESTLSTLEKKGKIKNEEIKTLASSSVEKLSKSKTGIGLTYLQVLLDRLYREAAGEEDAIPVLTPAILEDMGTFEDVIDDFLGEQLQKLEEELGEEFKGVPLKILGAMVSDERTKKILTTEDLQNLKTKFNLSQEQLNTCLQTFQTMRIIKSYEV